MSPPILKRAPIGPDLEDYEVLEDGVVVGRIFKVPVAPPDLPRMWASGHNGDPTRTDARGRDASVCQELASGMTSVIGALTIEHQAPPAPKPITWWEWLCRRCGYP